MKKHECKGDLPSECYGPAINICYEDSNGNFWVANGEYASRVKYCPYCGKKAPAQT